MIICLNCYQKNSLKKISKSQGCIRCRNNNLSRFDITNLGNGMALASKIMLLQSLMKQNSKILDPKYERTFKT